MDTYEDTLEECEVHMRKEWRSVDVISDQDDGNGDAVNDDNQKLMWVVSEFDVQLETYPKDKEEVIVEQFLVTKRTVVSSDTSVHWRRVDGEDSE
ncbi:unnamed protein product [marine sediment metagenome]|uniref:Uncharacterized protein n=1 Tax=marine sediment metagenome TaxID=412755 RepID=X1C641_9ZZZZ